MILQEISVKNFRNYDYQKVIFNENVNIIYGDNAQGKTNLLEAIYACSVAKSQRTRYDKEMIMFNHNEAHIKSLVKKNERDYVIDIHLKNNGNKGIAINKIIIDKTAELFDIIDVVFFSPEDLNIVKNGPSDRRKWLDYKISSINKNYYNSLLNYNKAIKNRNLLLININKTDNYDDSIVVWNKQIYDYGSKIISYRQKFIKRLNEIIFNIHKNISGGKDNLEVIYNKNVEIDNFENKLNKAYERDRKSGFTSVGPHRDDLIFLVNGNDARQFASQGQQKTVVVSLKLSEIQLIFEEKKDMPILLLDDVLSELDAKRQNFLLNSIKNIQTIITCTGIEDFVRMRYDINKLFYVNNGKIVEKN